MLNYNATSIRAILAPASTWIDFDGVEHPAPARVTYTVTHYCGCDSIVSSQFNVICVAPCALHEGSF